MKSGLLPMMMPQRFARSLPAALAVAADPAAHKLMQIGDAGGAARPYAIAEGIAIIGVQGALIDKLGWWGSSWVTGYDALRWQLACAHEDADVRGIVLDVDSYGGMVAGCFDLSDFALAAKQASGKPVAAILSEEAYSAGYAVASTADSIAVPRTGGCGSIGVVTMHVDMSGWLEKVGDKITLLKAGAHKTDGNPYEALPDDVRARIETELEDLRQLFAATVVRNRAGAPKPPSLDQVLATEARTYSGPAQLAEALTLGLADAILSPADAFAAFAAHVNAA
ncbi:S49 family peptidase [Parvibaculum sp.]|uniref:S49 family peptidase n=1 Tax=Parvibaculum sp. TaxID=2024848 RepID=UPI002604F4C4|nr:S49 family peptidase [Parvibaculum sp.]MCW5727242.1 S49 family peptidase [Parvibaculum sp.]